MTYYVYGLGLIGEASAGNYFSYHYDRRGSTVALTDESGQVTERFQYSPYGLVLSGDTAKTPFLFNGMYGVMTDDNGLYHMRARFYSPEIRRFVNQDVLLGNITQGQTLNRYAFVTGQPVSLIDPFGLFGQEDALSLTLDFIPIVGSCKGGLEFILGKDPVTGEPIPRWVAVIGIIPGGKYFTKTGEAVVYLYKGQDKHFSIAVKQGDKIIHTEQTVLDDAILGDAMKTRISYYIDDYGSKDKIRGKFEFDLPDAASAQEFQKSLVGKDTGKYDVDTNSCLSHVCETLRAGGVDAPIPDGSETWKKEAYKFLVKNRKK